MNMKKTMAALAACAVAVSAMATTVSAVEDNTLPYDLTEAIKVKTAGTATVTGSIADFIVLDDEGFVVGFDKLPAGYTLKSMTVTFKDEAGNAGSKVLKYDLKWGNDNWYSDSALVNKAAVVVAADAVPAGKYDVTVSAVVEHPYAQYAGSTSAIATDFDYNLVNAYCGPTVNPAGTAVAVKSAEIAVSGFVDVTIKTIQSPMETYLTGNEDIINYLNTAAVNGDDGKSYYNVGAVLNDAIKNYETVKFTFNAAKEPVRFMIKVSNADAGQSANYEGAETAIDKKIGQLEVELNTANKTLDAAKKTFRDAATNTTNVVWEKATAADKTASPAEAAAVVAAENAVKAKNAEIAAWNAAEIIPFYHDKAWEATDYSKFGQHLYNDLSGNGFFAGEATEFLGLDWKGYNLFQGGLVINEAYTMSLADTKMFDWNESSVSFDWDTIADAASSVYNPYALYLHNMELATSNRWFWDSMDVTLTAGAVEDATSDADVKNDDDVLEEDPIEEEEVAEEEITEEEITEEEVEEEATEEEATEEEVEEEATEEEVEEEATEEEVEEEATEEVDNPKTGNASVALAVIPVALAAAAVVAKKRS